jgi:hypothetical protein
MASDFGSATRPIRRRISVYVAADVTLLTVQQTSKVWKYFFPRPSTSEPKRSLALWFYESPVRTVNQRKPDDVLQLLQVCSMDQKKNTAGKYEKDYFQPTPLLMNS